MERWENKVAIVTGASAGIGEATVIRLVEAGMKVAGFARRAERVEKLANKLVGKKGKLYAVKCDLTSEDDILKGFKWVEENLGTVHVLINNAGVVRPTTLFDGDAAEWRRVIDTNVLGLSICTREAIKSMRSKSEEIAGHIIHINSIAGHYVPSVIPRANVYPASKFAVTALAQTLRHELNELSSKIKITSVSPGHVKTELATANGFVMDKEMEEKFKNIPSLEADNIADAVLYVLGTPPNVMIEELTIRPIGERI